MGKMISHTVYLAGELFQIFDFEIVKLSDFTNLIGALREFGSTELLATLKKGKLIPWDRFGFLDYGGDLFVLRYLEDKRVLQITLSGVSY